MCVCVICSGSAAKCLLANVVKMQVLICAFHIFISVLADLAEKKAIDGELTIKIAQETIEALHSDLNRKDS